MPENDLFLFVSHVSEDRAAAMEIVTELERRGIKCWIAPRNVHPGQPFDDEIVDAIEGSRAMLLIFSDRCNESEYIRREVTVAGESHKVIMPFRIEDAQPRRGLRVRLSDLHWIDAYAARERAIDELVRAVGNPVRPDGGFWQPENEFLRRRESEVVPQDLHANDEERCKQVEEVERVLAGTALELGLSPAAETPRAGLSASAQPATLVHQARRQRPIFLIGLIVVAIVVAVTSVILSGPSRQQEAPPSQTGAPTSAPAATSESANPAQQVEPTPLIGSPQAATGPPPRPTPTISPDYRMALSNWLESHKRYPEVARQRGEQGSGVLRFRVDRTGHVLDYAVIHSTGYADLDNAIQEMMHGAVLPPFPPSMTEPEIEASVTIRFGLSR